MGSRPGLDERHLRERQAPRRPPAPQGGRPGEDRGHGAPLRAMRISDSAGRTDAGRKRRRNEDAFVLDPPLFVVADGMGGAQAGEVASRLAAAAFREFHEADELEPEERVTAIIQEANRRIYERAREDTQASGMGTTITAALVGDESVSIGHVGDSRAYRLRGG